MFIFHNGVKLRYQCLQYMISQSAKNRNNIRSSVQVCQVKRLVYANESSSSSSFSIETVSYTHLTLPTNREV